MWLRQNNRGREKKKKLREKEKKKKNARLRVETEPDEKNLRPKGVPLEYFRNIVNGLLFLRIDNLCINLGGLQLTMAEKLAHGVDVDTQR